MIKNAKIEDSDKVDPKSGLKIRVSTTVRLLYRKAYPDEYASLRNFNLNEIIAKDFISNSSNVLHYFKLGKKGEGNSVTAEIRGSSTSFFISAIRGNTIDILTIQSSWMKPRYKGSIENPMEMGDS